LALLKAHFPQLTSEELLKKMLQTTDDLDTLNPAYRGLLGSGRLNVYRALHSNSLSNKFTFIDFKASDQLGNNDGLYHPGEKILLTFTFKNYGDQKNKPQRNDHFNEQQIDNPQKQSCLSRRRF
jgi:hypothetical protein